MILWQCGISLGMCFGLSGGVVVGSLIKNVGIDISKKDKFPYGAIVVKDLHREKAVAVLKL